MWQIMMSESCHLHLYYFEHEWYINLLHIDPNTYFYAFILSHRKLFVPIQTWIEYLKYFFYTHILGILVNNSPSKLFYNLIGT